MSGPLEAPGPLRSTVTHTHGIAVPELGNSKYLMGAGPGTDESGVLAERAGTAYWVYQRL
jgi:hypothetical protein